MLVESSRLSTILNLNDSYNNSSTKRVNLQKAGQTATSKFEPRENGKKAQPDINDWEYCNPDHLEDKLPQPFRLIDKIVYKDLLLKRVYREIEDIEKAKLHHNYEGGVREVNPVSFFESNGTSFLISPRPNPLNLLLSGDKYGNVCIFDLNRRIQLLKKEVFPSQRITALDAVSIEYCDDQLMTFAVVARGECCVHIIRVWSRDYKPVLSARIKTVRSISSPFNAQTKLDEFPHSVKFSDDGMFLSVTLFNGSVEIYHIPEPPLVMPAVVDHDAPGSLTQLKPSTSTFGFLNPNYNSKPPLNPQHNMTSAPAKQNTQSTSIAPGLYDTPIVDLQPFKKIPLRAPEKKIDAEKVLLRALLGPSQEELAAAQAVKEDKGKKGVKAPPAKKEDPQAQVIAQDQEKEFQLPAPEFEVNPEILMGEIVQELGADHSHELPKPKYFPHIFYTYRNMSYQPPAGKALNKEITITVTTGLICVWQVTCFMDIFELQEARIENAPTYYSFKSKYHIQNQPNKRHSALTGDPKIDKTPEIKESVSKKDEKPAGKANAKEPANQASTVVDAPAPKQLSSCQLLYPVRVATISKSNAFVAIGLADGSVVIWDLTDNRESYQLDKHLGAVTTISFLDDWHLMSGSVDGGLHLHKINPKLEDALECKKYQHVFKTKGNSITAIEINEMGLGFVMDKNSNFRGYDLYHFEKLMKLTPQSQYSRRCKFTTWPRPIICAGHEQLVVVCDVLDSNAAPTEGNETDPQKTWAKNSIIMIYRTFESMANLLPGIASLLKKGFDKNKVMNAFSKLTIADLKNPNYDIPQFKTEQVGTGMSKVLSAGKDSSGAWNADKKKTLTMKSGGGSSLGSFNSSFDGHGMKRKPSLKGDTNKVNAQRLTQEVLHPEQFLLQKRNDPGPAIADTLKNTLTGMRERTSDKISRVERLQNYYTQIKEDLDLKEQEEVLQKRKENILKQSRK